MPNIPAFGNPIAAATLLNNEHLVSMLLAYCDIHDIVRFATSTKVNAATACKYLACHLCNENLPFFVNTKQFFEIMCTCDAVISGSVALHFLPATNQTNWTPTDLDLYMPKANVHQLVSLLGDHGYQVVHQGEVDNSPYTHSNIHTMVSLSNNSIRKIDVVVSKRVAAAAPIFQFHSTIVMNFVSPSRYFCAYPALTFHGLSMVNPGPLYVGRHGQNAFSVIPKYQNCGFHYISCSEAHELNFTCKNMPCTLTDRWCMWVDTSTLPHVSVFGSDIFEHYSFLDICWVLGGMVCGVQDGYVNPHIAVIRDAS